MKNKSVIKHSATVQITNRISLFQRKTFNVLLAHAYYDLPIQERFEISEQALKKALNIRTRDQELLKQAFEALVTCAVKFNDLGKDKKHAWGISALLSYATVEGGLCTYEYSSFLREMLYKPEIYARINLSLQNKFNSKHALALYELCIDYYIAKDRCGSTPYIEVTEFRALMGLSENQYTLFKHLKNDVIKPAVKEINDKSDLSIEVEQRRESRRVTALRFNIKPNPKPENQVGFKPALLEPKSVKIKTGQQRPISAAPPQFTPGTTDPAEKALLDQVVSYGTDLTIARQSMDEHGLVGANDILSSAIARHQSKPKRDFAAYLAQAFRRGWGLKSPEKRQAERLKAERMIARSAKFEKGQTEKTRAESEEANKYQRDKDTRERQKALVAGLSESDSNKLRRLAIEALPSERRDKMPAISFQVLLMVEKFVTMTNQTV